MNIEYQQIGWTNDDVLEKRFRYLVRFQQPENDVRQVMKVGPQLGELARKYLSFADAEDVISETVGLKHDNGKLWEIICQCGPPRTDGALKLVPEHAGAVG